MSTAVIEYTPRGASREVFERREPEVLLDGPAGTGKSRACLEKLHLAAMKYPHMRGIIVRKIRADLSEAAVQTFETHVLSPYDGVHKVGGSNVRHYDYPNGSRIVVAGLDRDTNVMSAEYDLAYAQEATELDEQEWEKLGTRLRNGKMPYQQLIADCNPDAPTHWLNQRCNDGTTVRLTSRHEDNPVLWDAEHGAWTTAGVAYMARLDTLTGARKDRLRHGRWVAAEGMIYIDAWDSQRNLIANPWGGDPPPDWPRYWTVDFGFTNPFVCQFWAESPDGELYRYREVYRTQRLVEDHAKVLLAQMDVKPRAIICDHDAEDRATLERHLNMRTYAAQKDVSLGIQAVAGRLRPAENGRPRLYLVRGALVDRDLALRDERKPTCTEEEVEGYVWNDHVRREEPRKDDDHGMDAMRYMVAFRDWTLRSGQPKSVRIVMDDSEGAGMRRPGRSRRFSPRLNLLERKRAEIAASRLNARVR